MTTLAHAPGATVLETPRLALRTWRDSDVTPFIAAMNTPAVMRWLGGVQDAAAARASIARWQGYQAEHGHSFWIVERQADRAMLGFCGLKRCDAPGAPMIGAMEIGWRLREDAWGNGYAREAAQACLDAAFTTFDADDVIAITVAANAPSWGLMQRLGMIRARACDFHDPRQPLADGEKAIVYRIERRDWMQ